MNTSMFDCETNCLQCQWSLNETNPSTNETTLTAASFINTSAVQCQVPSLTKLLPTPESYAGSSYRIAAYVSVSQNAQVEERVLLFVILKFANHFFFNQGFYG